MRLLGAELHTLARPLTWGLAATAALFCVLSAGFGGEHWRTVPLRGNGASGDGVPTRAGSRLGSPGR